VDNLIGLFQKSKNALEKGGFIPPVEEKLKCPNCGRTEAKKAVVKNRMVCSGCGYHYKLSARERIALIFDKDSFTELYDEVRSEDPLGFPGYSQKLRAAAASSGETEAVLCGTAAIQGLPCAAFVMEPAFMMASMGSAVGERVTRLFELAALQNLPVVGFTASGGARMQEGILSLMQMAKVSGAVRRHSERGLFYAAVLTDPTTGGVTASFAMLSDIILAEPGATIGFAGRRVIEQAMNSPLPEGFQSAEFQLAHGFVDRIVPRQEQRALLQRLLAMHKPKGGAPL
jgi:acetyl-CoA carboxylase carboxyl transferase beta subunit